LSLMRRSCRQEHQQASDLSAEPAQRCRSLVHQVATADELTDALIRYALQDYAHAIALIVPLADRGNVVAQMQLGLIYARDKALCDVQATGSTR
jgi:hypothetical protein